MCRFKTHSSIRRECLGCKPKATHGKLEVQPKFKVESVAFSVREVGHFIKEKHEDQGVSAQV